MWTRPGSFGTSGPRPQLATPIPPSPDPGKPKGDHAHNENGLHLQDRIRRRTAPAGAKCLMAWRSCVRDRSLTAHKLLTDRSLRRLPDGNRSCNLRGTVSPFGPRFTDHLNMRGARALTLRKKGEVS